MTMDDLNELSDNAVLDASVALSRALREDDLDPLVRAHMVAAVVALRELRATIAALTREVAT